MTAIPVSKPHYNGLLQAEATLQPRLFRRRGVRARPHRDLAAQLDPCVPLERARRAARSGHFASAAGGAGRARRHRHAQRLPQHLPASRLGALQPEAGASEGAADHLSLSIHGRIRCVASWCGCLRKCCRTVSTRRTIRSIGWRLRSGAASSSSISTPLPARRLRRASIRPPATSRTGRSRDWYQVTASAKLMNCNWKIFWENFNECLHCPGVHKHLSQLVPIYGRGLMARHDDPDWQRHADNDAPEFSGGLKRGAETWSEDGRAHGPKFAGLSESERAAGQTYATHLPSMFVVGHVDYVRTVSLRPVGPEQTELTAEWLFAPEALASDSVRPRQHRLVRRAGTRGRRRRLRDQPARTALAAPPGRSADAGGIRHPPVPSVGTAAT